MASLRPNEFSLANHCECGHPMVVMLDDDDMWRGGAHDPERETWGGLAAALDAHHKAMLCGSCDGTDEFDVDRHYGACAGASTLPALSGENVTGPSPVSEGDEVEDAWIAPSASSAPRSTPPQGL